MGKGLPSKRLDSGLFYSQPSYKYLSDLITFESTVKARENLKTLWYEFKHAKTRDKKMRIWRSVDLAWKRAEAMLKRGDIKPSTKRKYRELVQLYRRVAEAMHRELKKGG